MTKSTRVIADRQRTENEVASTEPDNDEVMLEVHEALEQSIGGRHTRLGKGLFILFVGASLVLTALMLFGSMPRHTLGLLGLALTITMMMAGIHIVVAMALP